MLSRFFINRPIFATVLSILIVVAGVITLRSLPVEQYPTITPPTVVVEAQYPGANATTIAQMVATPIEQQVNGVEGMLYMSSTSSSAGVYRLTVTFEVGTDLDMATVLVQNRVNMTLSSLPQEVTKIGVTTTKESTNVVMFLTLTSDNPSYDALYLSNYAELNLVNELSRVKGVGSVGEFGAGNYSTPYLKEISLASSLICHIPFASYPKSLPYHRAVPRPFPSSSAWNGTAPSCTCV